MERPVVGRFSGPVLCEIVRPLMIGRITLNALGLKV